VPPGRPRRVADSTTALERTRSRTPEGLLLADQRLSSLNASGLNVDGRSSTLLGHTPDVIDGPLRRQLQTLKVAFKAVILEIEKESHRAGLRALANVEGTDVVVEFRWADGDAARLAGLARDLVLLPGAANVEMPHYYVTQPGWFRWRRRSGFPVRRTLLAVSTAGTVIRLRASRLEARLFRS